MAEATPNPEALRKYRKDYRPPRHRVRRVALTFDLDPARTRVRARLEVERDPDREAGPLELDGEGLELGWVAVDGERLSPDRYQVTKEQLVIRSVPDRCVVETEVFISPEANTALSGLYVSSGNFCTQCEAEGFRRITYFTDRPDVMATYETTLVADPERFPVLLSNGNRVEEGTTDDGRHWVRWEDPFPKPSYLFALVGGKLARHQGTFTTRSGRAIQLEIWVEPHNVDKCEHALASLQRAMRWDEEVFGLEYDLDLYMIVAVGDFNMGAMENKGLNVFNAKYVLARPDTATDDDYEHIEGVVAHEYFHNWTGNRVTCRDWFQLTLKEGLTVFRDQQFTADMTSAAVKRISDVRLLRSAQFEEDAGPMAHPIRPDSYVEMNNFYTPTVYIKGAEIIRIYHTLLGQEGFRKGMDLYFERHDGQAVTCDDFRRAMADANGVNLDRMEGWYAQAGTPEVHVSTHHDPSARRFTLRLRQSRPLPEGQPPWTPVPIPVRMALLDDGGAPLPLRLDGEPAGTEAPRERVLRFEDEEATFVFEGIDARPTPSLFRHFSAPVKVRMEASKEELLLRFAKDGDPFNRWDAGQRLAEDELLRLAAAIGRNQPAQPDEAFVEAYGALLEDPNLDGSLRALAMQLPSERLLAQQVNPVDPESIFSARQALRTRLVEAHGAALERLVQAGIETGDPVARRREKNAALQLLSLTDRGLELARAQYDAADNMTDQEAALYAVVDRKSSHRSQMLADFHDRWSGEPLVLDKWFSVQASSRDPDTVQAVQELARHPDFTLHNPNRVRALVGAFAMGNPVRFHDPSGAGYRFLEQMVLALDGKNPQVAARLVSAFNAHRRYEPGRQAQMQAALERIAARAQSKDVLEIVGQALA
jgi:aminopeptidase N